VPNIHHERETGVERPMRPSPVEWRFGRLVDTGFPRGLAARLARDTRYDLHSLIELVERGCAPALAARILAPLDDEAQAA
jgi:hypothetical protein